MEQMISNLGFPIASAVGIAFYFVQKDKATREDKNKIITKYLCYINQNNILTNFLNLTPFNFYVIFSNYIH